MNRLRQSVENPNWDISQHRNNIFKAANLLGIKLPHMMFATDKAGEDMADSDELAKTWFNTEDPEEGVEDSGAGGAAHLFFDNPNKRETREFAESGADSNDPDSSDGSKTPPTPTEIREDEAGGEAFSTLNRLVVETDHPTEDAMPEGHDDVEKSEKVLKQAGMPDPRYLAKGLLKVDPDSKSAGGDKCPFCGSHDVSYMTGRDEGLEIRGSHAFHSLQCYNCHSEWEEHFSLKLKKMDVRKYPSKVLQSKPVDASPVGRTKIWSVGKSAASSLLDAWGIIGEDE